MKKLLTTLALGLFLAASCKQTDTSMRDLIVAEAELYGQNKEMQNPNAFGKCAGYFFDNEKANDKSKYEWQRDHNAAETTRENMSEIQCPEAQLNF